MDDESVRIEWRESEEQSQACVALVREWAARRSLVWAGACSVGLVLALFAGSLWVGSAVGAFLLLVLTLIVAEYFKARSAVARDRVRAWISAARARRPDAFREPAAGEPAGSARSVRIDANGVASGGVATFQICWAAVHSVRSLAGGHVLVSGRRGVTGLYIPAWAFEADAQREMFLEHARAWHSRAKAAPTMTSSIATSAPDGFEIALPITFALVRRQAYRPGWLIAALLALFGLGVGWIAQGLVPRDLFFGATELKWVLPALGASIAFAFATRTGRALLSTRALARHRAYRLRFSPEGFGLETALQSSTSPWSHVTVEQKDDAIVVNHFVIPDDALTRGQIDAILVWKAVVSEPTKEVAPTIARPSSGKRWWVVPLFVFIGFIVLTMYQLMRSSDPPSIEAIVPEEPTYTPAPPRDPHPACELPENEPPEPVLEEDVECADLADALVRVYGGDDQARIMECVAIDFDNTLTGAAIVLRPNHHEMWLRERARWRPAGLLLSWSVSSSETVCDGSISDMQLHVGGPPELVVTMDCELSDRSNRRYLSACGLERGRPVCWWTIVTADTESRIDSEETCNAWSYLVRSAASLDPTSVWTGDDRIILTPSVNALVAPPGGVPPGRHALEDLIRFDISRALQ